MITDLIKKIENLNLMFYKKIEITENKIIMSLTNKPNAQYQLLIEVSKVIEVVDKEIFEFEYEDAEDTITIYKK